MANVMTFRQLSIFLCRKRMHLLYIQYRHFILQCNHKYSNEAYASSYWQSMIKIKTDALKLMSSKFTNV